MGGNGLYFAEITAKAAAFLSLKLFLPSLSIPLLGIVPSSVDLSLLCSSCSKNNLKDLFVFLRVSGKAQHFLSVSGDCVISQDPSLMMQSFICILSSSQKMSSAGSWGWRADLHYRFPLLAFIMIIHDL